MGGRDPGTKGHPLLPCQDYWQETGLETEQQKLKPALFCRQQLSSLGHNACSLIHILKISEVSKSHSYQFERGELSRHQIGLFSVMKRRCL